jgi:DNA-binding LacI/PurR family transcriptional regulator
MTVSLALRGGDKAELISPATRARVLQVARELRYSPSARARGLRSGVTNVIGFYFGHGHVNVRMPFFTEIIGGLQEGCELHHKDLLLHSTFRSHSTAEIYNELRDGRIDGLIVIMSPRDPLVSLLAEAHFPVVSVASPLPGLSAVTVDDRGGSRLLGQHLFEKGHRRCLYAVGHVGGASVMRRRDGFLEIASELGIDVQEAHLAATPDASEVLMEHWLSLAPTQRATAVVCWNDDSAYAFLACCRQHGIRVPDEVAVVGFDGCPTPYDSFWGLTTIRAPWTQAAQLAVEHLNALIQGHSVPSETILPVELISGHTT